MKQIQPLITFCFLLFLTFNQNIFSKSFAFFSPDDGVECRLIEMINKTKAEIKVAIYMLTSKQIAQALVNARGRGVKIQVVIDKSSVDSEFSKIEFLKNGGVEIFLFKPKKAKRYCAPLMHNKFAIFEVSPNERWVWSGSFNWTRSANSFNQENVILTSNKKIYQQYTNQFETLKKRCFLQGKRIKKTKPVMEDSLIDQISNWLSEIKKRLQFS